MLLISQEEAEIAVARRRRHRGRCSGCSDGGATYHDRI